MHATCPTKRDYMACVPNFRKTCFGCVPADSWDDWLWMGMYGHFGVKIASQLCSFWGQRALHRGSRIDRFSPWCCEKRSRRMRSLTKSNFADGPWVSWDDCGSWRPIGSYHVRRTANKSIHTTFHDHPELIFSSVEKMFGRIIFWLVCFRCDEISDLKPCRPAKTATKSSAVCQLVNLIFPYQIFRSKPTDSEQCHQPIDWAWIGDLCIALW